jgi:sigma-B regulation protein RsbU (phosphoserine phosphatase)
MLGALLLTANMCPDGSNIINESRNLNPYVRIIILTEFWNLDFVRRLMKTGVYDCLVYPEDSDVLADSIEMAVQQSLTRRNAAMTRQKLLALHRDLAIAGEVQKFILPAEHADFSGCHFRAQMIPTRDIGGDFYDYFTIDPDRVGFVIGDVSGKGIPAAVFMAITRSLIKMIALETDSTSLCLQQVNRALSQENPSLMFATVVYAILNIRNHELEICNAGHNLPYLLKSDSPPQMIPGSGNMALGFDQEAAYQGTKIQLKHGDKLVLYTDGVTEASDIQHHMYGQKRMERLLQQKSTATSDDLIAGLLADLSKFTGHADQADDITLLCLAVDEARSDHADVHSEAFAFSMQNRIEQLADLQTKIAQFCKTYAITFRDQNAIELALEEIFINIINHAFSDSDEHTIEFTIIKSGQTVHITVMDDGIPFDPSDVKEPIRSQTLAEMTPGGWGLTIVKKYMHDIKYTRQNIYNVLIISRKLS